MAMVTRYRRLPPPVRLALYLLGCLSASAMWIGVLWLLFRPGLDVWVKPERYPLVAALYLAGTYMILLGGALWAWRKLQGGRLRALGLSLRGMPLGLVLGFGSLSGLFAIEVWSGLLEWHPAEWRATPWALIGTTAASALFFGASEELLFRGFFYRTLRRGWGVGGAIAGSALCYAGVHFLRFDLHWTQIVTPFAGLALAGALLAWTVERTRALGTAIGLHAAWVFLFLLTDRQHLLGYPPSTSWLTGGGYPLGGVLAMALLLALWGVLGRLLHPRRRLASPGAGKRPLSALS